MKLNFRTILRGIGIPRRWLMSPRELGEIRIRHSDAAKLGWETRRRRKEFASSPEGQSQRKVVEKIVASNPYTELT
jgi:hypothetical protein